MDPAVLHNGHSFHPFLPAPKLQSKQYPCLSGHKMVQTILIRFGKHPVFNSLGK